MKTYAVELKDCSRQDFDLLKTVADNYSLPTDTSSLHWIQKNLAKAENFKFRCTRKELQLLITIVDISSLHNVLGFPYEYERVHRLFRRLEQKYLRMFRQPVYVDADTGASTSQEAD